MRASSRCLIFAEGAATGEAANAKGATAGGNHAADPNTSAESF
jgi:hypothetical protein